MNRFQALACIVAVCVLHSTSSAQPLQQRIKQAVARADASIAKVVATPGRARTFANTFGALDKMNSQLDRDTSLPIFMQYVSTDSTVREDARAAQQILDDWLIELSKREDLYKAIKSYADTKPKLQGEQARLLSFTLRDYRRAGMMLPIKERNRLKVIEKELSVLEIEFDRNIADDETRVMLTLAELKGVPKEVVDRQQSIAGVVMLRLDGPSYGAVMDYCEVPETRQKCWMAYRRRAGMRNVQTLEKMLALRAEAARLLGYKNRVDFEVETRMAKNSETIAKFYSELRGIVRRKSEVDLAEFTEAKRRHLGDPSAEFNQWDYSFYKNRLKAEKYALDSQKVAEYFPMDRVVEGLFSITSSLYGIEYRDVTSQAAKLGLPLWHPDAKLYEVVEADTKELLGRLYTDLYPREGKYTHAACWGLWPRRVNEDGTVDKPLVALVCNFTKPTSDKPSLLPHDEVETFFHEFGHGLHHLFSRTRYARFSGTAVMRDFVEAPSQMMENWVWAPEVLKTFAKHYKTGELLPDELLNGMKRARTLGSGLETEGQFYLGLMDQAFHTVPSGKVDTVKLADEVYGKSTLYKPHQGTFYHASFGHLTGYQGAYYGYLWSLVFAQDLFQRFEELGLLNPAAGKQYRDKVLSKGGSVDADVLLRAYLGREPRIEAFYRHLGLEGASREGGRR